MRLSIKPMNGKFLLGLMALAVVSGCLQQQQQPEVVFIEAPKVNLKAHLVECTFDKFVDGNNRYTLFYKVWNAGETATKVPSKICIAHENSQNPHCRNLNQAYHNGQVLWNEISWPDGRVGQEFFIETSSDTVEDLSYGLYLNEDLHDLTKSSATLAEGRTGSCRIVQH